MKPHSSTRLHRSLLRIALISGLSVHATPSFSQAPSGYTTDPATGIVYRAETRTVERPVVDVQVQKQEHTVYRPQTVSETKTEPRTVYLPVVEHHWEARVHGRWNPFVQPTVAYHHVPRTRWEAKTEAIPTVQTRTQWIAEKQTIDVPTRVVRIDREQRTEYIPVGRVATPPVNGASEQIVARLRPLDSQTPVQPFGTPAASIAANYPIGAPASRSLDQSAMRATELSPTAVYGPTLPVPGTGVGIARQSLFPLWR
jgi:hypothetical protein